MAKAEADKAAKGSKTTSKSATKTPAKTAAAKRAPAKKKPTGRKATPEKPQKTAAKPRAKPSSKAAKKVPVKKPAAKKAAPEKEKKAPKKPAAKKPAPKKEKKAPRKKAPAKKPVKKPAEEAPTKAPVKEPAKTKPAAKKAPAKTKPKAPPKPEVPPKTEDDLLLFNRWDFREVEVADPGLKRYMNLTPTYLPHTGGRWANRAFTKARVNLVERFVNNMMRTERYTGKKNKTIKVVENAFALVEKRVKRNPIQVLVDGLEKAAPREEVTRLRFGGISVPRAVDVAPARRLDLALRNITTGAVRATFKTPKSASQCLADELLMAANGDINSYAIGKKEEMERIAASAR
ncbi:MAG: 30S ribosomal protein S7 [Thermoplasmata archaeon]